jgi:hypothetical protein
MSDLTIIETRPGYKTRPRRPNVKVDALVIHESVSPTKARTVRVLLKKGCGVHYLVDRDGKVYNQTPIDRTLAHAGRLNRRSIGIEVVSPYYPTSVPKDWPDQPRVIPAGWAHRKQYALPPAIQMESLWSLIKHLVNTCEDITTDWVGLLPGNRFAMARVKGAKKRGGIHAHTYTHHADGAFPVLYCYLLSTGIAPVMADDRAVALASGAKRRIQLDQAVT